VFAWEEERSAEAGLGRQHRVGAISLLPASLGRRPGHSAGRLGNDPGRERDFDSHRSKVESVQGVVAGVAPDVPPPEQLPRSWRKAKINVASVANEGPER